MENEYKPKQNFTEKDWKLFRNKIPQWQENYMKRLNEKYIAILSQNKKASEIFWELNDRIKNDHNSAGVIVDMRRSRLIQNLLALLHDKVITIEDLEEFSDVLKETIRFLY